MRFLFLESKKKQFQKRQNYELNFFEVSFFRQLFLEILLVDFFERNRSFVFQYMVRSMIVIKNNR